MSKDKKGRVGEVITIGSTMRNRIPQLFTDIYRIVTSPVDDNEDVEKDETFKIHTLRTVFVEGLTGVPGKKAVSVNGEFEIDLEKNEDDETEADMRENVYADKEKAVSVWRYLSQLQWEKFEREEARLAQVKIALRNSIDGEQY